MTINTPILISPQSQAGILKFGSQCYSVIGQNFNLREQMRRVDLAYARENDLTQEQYAAKMSNRAGDPTKFQNITMPVVMPTVEAAVVYQSSVFLSGNPIFGVVANPELQDIAMQMEALMEEHSVRGGWARQLQMFLRDGFKYNISAIEAVWKDEVTASLETDALFSRSKQGKPKEIIWSGNCIKRLDMYNTFFDTRVSPIDVSKKGEYAGYTELMSRTYLKQYVHVLPNKIVQNLRAAYESPSPTVSVGSTDGMGYHIPHINNDALYASAAARQGMNWLDWVSASNAKIDINYKNHYEVTTLYARIIPSDFNLKVPSSNTPQVWKFIIVNRSVLIYAERQTNAHENIPIFFGCPLEDGLSYQTKSLATNVQPIQEVASAMINSNMAARRRAVSDRGLYDPSRISTHIINSAIPDAKMPVRPLAYGKPLNEAYYPIPFNDNQSATIMQELQSILQLPNIISGQNPARGGQFVKGNKTQSEYADVMAHSNGRDQNISILLEAQVFTPLKEVLKLNILQYQGATSVYYRDKAASVDIDPVALRKAIIEFKVTDGLTPASKLINSDAYSVALQVIGSSPQIAAAYNVGALVSYMFKTQGALVSDFEKTKEQVAYESAVQQWVAMAQESIGKGIPWTQLQPIPEQFGYLAGGKLAQSNPPQEPSPLEKFTSTLTKTAQTNPANPPQ